MTYHSLINDFVSTAQVKISKSPTTQKYMYGPPIWRMII